MMRRILAGGIALLAICTGRTMPHAQTADAAPRAWTGTWEEHHFAERNSGFTRTQTRVTFTLTEGRDANGFAIWTSRAVQWSYRSESASFDSVAVEERPPDERGFTLHRFRQDQQTICTSAGTIELGPSLGTDRLLLPKPDQETQLGSTCVTDTTSRETGVTTRTTSTGDRIGFPGIPGDDQFQQCQYHESWRRELAAGYYEGSFQVTRAPVVDAVMQIDRAPDSAYARFVPSPGGRLTFTASVPSGTARFRFELDPERTSHFPGYAANAPVDAVFFEKYNLAHWRGAYPNDGPDLVFDSWNFADRDEWSRIEPDVAETAVPRSAATVTVTAMDFGAVGKLRAFVSAEGCEGWQPVAIRVGSETRDAVAIPMDEDDNLIADALDDYRGRLPGVDDDAEPKGNGMTGDGLTLFEEYRGFLVRGVGCGSEETRASYSESELANQSQVYGWSDVHERTPPGTKDLFIHSPDAELALAAPAFADATGLRVHLICEQHYVDNASRIVNFTLHQAGQRSWQGRQIALDEPQHGLRLEPVARLGLRGVSIPVAEGYLGPPKLTVAVQVTKPGFGASCAACLLEYGEFIHTAVHELGHSVGIPHHGDGVENFRVVPGRQNITTGLSLQQHAGGPPDFTLPNSVPADPGNYYAAVEGRNYLTSLLVEPGGDCVEGAEDATYYKDGRFAGCYATSIARRGQQNSGEFECPMRYSGSHYYEAPGTVAEYRWTDRVASKVFGRLEPGFLVDAWGGTLLAYRNDLDRDGAGQMCTRVTGTEINGLPGNQNHAGDAGRDKACADFIVVSDVAARGIR